MNLLNVIGDVFKPVNDLVDNLHTSDKEKGELKNQLALTATAAYQGGMDYAKGLVSAQAEVIKSETQGQSWIQRNWRPYAMVAFILMIAAHWFGFTPPNLSPQSIDRMFDLVELGVGGYIGARTLEKIAPNFIEGLLKLVKK